MGNPSNIPNLLVSILNCFNDLDDNWGYPTILGNLHIDEVYPITAYGHMVIECISHLATEMLFQVLLASMRISVSQLILEDFTDLTQSMADFSSLTTRVSTNIIYK